MSSYTNLTNVPLSLAVFLATDHYDYDPTAISATTLLRPVRQIVLPSRVPPEQAKTDVLQLVASRMGSAIHDSIEKAWVDGHYRQAMTKLGYPEKVIDKVVVNPPQDVKLPPGSIPVYMEQRFYRELDGRKVSGKVDFIAEGRLEDFKSTSTFTWQRETKDADYQLQGSIYRWLAPDIITEDYMVIQFIFTDWKAGFVKTQAGYPPRRVEPKKIPLLSLDDTEQFIRQKVAAVDAARQLPEAELPRCSDKELWREAPVYKYYKNPQKLDGCSTKNFDNLAAATQRLIEDGNVGIIITKPGQVKACKWCAAFPVCSQKDEYLKDGSLTIED